MGKRSSFGRRPMDAYQTPHKGVLPLLPYLRAAGVTSFDEPCAGRGDLIDHLRCYQFRCLYSGDIQAGADALDVPAFRADCVITNPPWTRALLHPLIRHFMQAAPYAWLLFDSDWAHTKQAAELIRHCTDIVTVGRLRWIPNSKHYAKDNAAWYRFDVNHTAGPLFHGRPWEPSLLDLMEAA